MCVLAATVLKAEPVRLFYMAGTKAYEISRFEEGLPVLDSEVELDENIWASGEKWAFTGELPIDGRYAAPTYPYFVSKQPKTYSIRNDEDRYRVRPDRFYRSLQSWSRKEVADAIFVFGWITGGTISRVMFSTQGASDRYRIELELSGELLDPSGYLAMWAIKDGRPLELMPSSKFSGSNPITSSNSTKTLAKLSDGNLTTSLHIAALNGNLSLVKSLIDEGGAKVDAKTKNGKTPLHFAAQCGRADVVEYLLLNGAKRFAEDEGKNTPIKLAAENGHLDALRLLAPGEAKGSKQKFHYSTALISAIRNDYQSAPIHLLDKGGKIDFKNKEAHKAALSLMRNGKTDLAFWIRDKYKVDPAFSDKGFNFLHAAAGYADVELLQRLKEEGVSVDEKSDSGLTPAVVATGHGNVEAICWLLDNGGRVEGKARVDPVLHAVANRAPSSVVCLIDYGFDVNRQHETGFTPVMLACSLGERAIAESLLDAGGAWVFDEKFSDDTIVDAIELDSPKVLQALIKQGLEPGYKVYDSISLADVAAFNQSQEVLAFLEKSYPNFTDISLVKAALLSEPIKIVKRHAISYPIEMQEKHGDQDILIEMAVLPTGDIGLINTFGDVHKELGNLVIDQLKDWRFDARENDESIATIKFRMPLRTTLREEDIFEMQDLTEPPIAISRAKPNYPYSAWRSGGSGVVMAEWIIATDGSVVFPKIIKSSSVDFEAPALESIKRSVWSPGKIDGKPVAVRVRQEMTFSP